jgi:ribonuclease BN (tRNA processing enzyme)
MGKNNTRMRVRILGTIGEIEESSERHILHSGVLVDDTILLDLGEKEFLSYLPQVVFITHLHPDHAFFIRGGHIEVRVPFYAPELSEKASEIILPNGPIHFKSYLVTPIPTVHSKLVKSTAYLIEKGDQKLLYTGDLIWINKEYRPLLHGLDLVITEGSHIRRGGMVRRDKRTGQIYGHNGIPDLVHMFSEYTKNVLLLHFGKWFFDNIRENTEKLSALGRENNVTVHVSYDGMELDLESLR